MDVRILTLVVLWMSLVLSLVVLILGLLNHVQLLHDSLSLRFVLILDLLDHLFRLRGWVEGSFVHVLALQALWRIKSIRVLRSSHR